MAIVTTDNQYYTAIANAIRGKNGTETTYKPAEMAAAITAIPSGGSGGSPLSELQRAVVSAYISNGLIDLAPYVDDFSKVKWIIALPSNSINGTYRNGYVWNSSMGTKYCIQIGGEERIAIYNGLGASYQTTDEGEKIALGSFPTGPSCYIDVQGTSFTIADGTYMMNGTVYCNVFYEE